MRVRKVKNHHVFCAKDWKTGNIFHDQYIGTFLNLCEYLDKHMLTMVGHDIIEYNIKRYPVKGYKTAKLA